MVEAHGDDPELRRRGLEDLFAGYSIPILEYTRRLLGTRRDQAEDVVQEFFVHLMEGRVLELADPASGRFRHYIKGVLRNFVVDHLRRTGRAKRGGDAPVLSLDRAIEAGLRPAVDVEEAGAALDREWATRLMDLAMESLVRTLEAEGRGRDLEIFRRYVATPEGAERPTYKDLAAAFDVSERTVWKALARTRERYRTLVAREVSRTVARPEDVGDEVESLLELLA